MERQINNLNDEIHRLKTLKVNSNINDNMSSNMNIVQKIIISILNSVFFKFFMFFINIIEYFIFRNKYLEIDYQENKNNIIVNYFYDESKNSDYSLISVSRILLCETIVLNSLLDLFKNTKLKIERLVYGYYTEKQMKDLAKISKYIIYFSFYDTGAIGLKEIQNYGVYAFTHQKDLAINNNTSFFIPELSDESDMNQAYLRIVQIIKNISISEPNLKKLAKINQEINRCENALDDLCNSIL